MPLPMRFARAGPSERELVLPSRSVMSAILDGCSVIGRHGPEELTLGVGRPFPAGRVEPEVELLLSLGDADGGVVEGDRVGSGRGIPDGLAELLEEVGITAGLAEHELRRVAVPRHVMFRRRLGEREQRVDLGEGVDGAVVEEPLGVRLRGGQVCRQAREAAADDEPRQARLARPVARAAHRRHLVDRQLLHLVDEDDDADVVLLRRRADRFGEVDEIELEIAAVGPAGETVEAEAHALDTDGRLERRDRSERVTDLLGGPPEPTLLPARRVRQFGREGGREVVALGVLGLDLHDEPAAFHRPTGELAEEHRLADTPQPAEHDAPGDQPTLGAVRQHLERLDVVVAPGERRRAQSRPGVVGVRRGSTTEA